MSDPTLTSAPEPGHTTATVAGAGADAVGGDAHSPPPGYELHSLIGSGGMGCVYRARDLELARDVAVKILLPQYAPDSATARRFVDEAHITGRLQHPGIPAIYRVGTLADGRPFLAMKLIDGRTLEEMLQERTAPEVGNGTSLTVFEQDMHEKLDRLEAILQRGRFLAIFEQVAQAVGYAHQQGVIHRDLKPSNVMVGAFGEVQVMDWGIARSGDRRQATGVRENIGPGATVDYSPPSELRTPHSDLTQAGAILGTPAFMPPEQAIGAVDRIGKPSDVFGLGAILCVILTGRPPFVADSAETTRQFAARGKLDDAFTRLDACGAEPELIALAKRCLSPEIAGRPADAGEVAKAVAALRADAERRARQAETDRATTEVKVVEERKRRRVQRILALALLVLLAVTGYTVRRIDNEQAGKRHDREARLRQEADEANARVADLKARQLVTERDVNAALNEVQVLREQGLKQADDPERWALTLAAARSSLKRAEGLLASGAPTDDPVLRVAAAHSDLTRDERDRRLLAELDRIADNNEIRLLIPISFTSVVSRQYAAAFRANGIDLAEVPTEEAVAWLKKQRFRDRLTLAVRGWVNSLSPTEGSNGFGVYGLSVTPELNELAKPAAGPKKPSRREKLEAILTAVVDDPFVREWWEAVASNNTAALKKLLTRPELHRMSSRELASLADGLMMNAAVQALGEFLVLAYDRFPGEFWIHFRLALVAEIPTGTDDPRNAGNTNETLRHLTAAVAARPKSAIARTALGMELLEKRKDDPAGLRMLKSASEVDPTSPWPHIFPGMEAVEKENWVEATAAFNSAVRADPDTAYFMIHTILRTFSQYVAASDKTKAPSDEHVSRLVEEVAAVNPNHPGSHDLLGEQHMRKRNYRAALIAFRKANQLADQDYARKPILDDELGKLEKKARWEGKIPVAPGGTVTPANGTDAAEIAGYFALFEKKYARAAEVAAAGLKADPDLFDIWLDVARFAGWAVQAASGNGVDSANLTPVQRTQLRQQALAWLREIQKRVPKTIASTFGSYISILPDFVPVRDAKELAKLPPDERAEWERLWAEFAPPEPPPKPHAREVAPPPRPVK